MNRHPHLPPSPALIRLLNSFLKSSEVATVLATYESKGENIGGDLFNRGDASFNPRLCRILQILIDECSIRDLATIIASIEYLDANPIIPEGNPSDAVAVLYADMLDRVRHAHFHLNEDEFKSLVTFANKLPSDKFPSVLTKIRHMISKRERVQSL